MSLVVGPKFRMTRKTRVYLWLYHRFHWFSKVTNWLLTHCDKEDAKSD